MSTARTAAQIGLITTGTIVTAALGYAVYFDYQRRNNPDFRKGIKKQHKKVAAAAEARAQEQKEKDKKLLRIELATIQSEPQPASPDQQELYFQEQVAEGERLAALGDEYSVKAAGHFYRALRVYPQPVELLMIYQKVCPPKVFSLLVELTTLTGQAGGSAGAPQRATASLADIDDSGPTGPGVGVSAGSPVSSGNGSGVEGWDRLSQEGA